jgi:gamma-glutamyltranspeptidase / glutathione hydrolase
VTPLLIAALSAWRMAVAADHTLASEAGLEAMRAGGNAVDAACATAFALGVVDPQSSGIGGGGFLLYQPAHGRAVALDFRETAPAAASRGMFAQASSTEGGLAVAVPGEVAGCAEAVTRWGRWGRLGLRRALGPAIRLAAGFPAGAELVQAAHRGGKLAWLPAEVGETVRRPELLATLRVIARRGPAGFYRGRVARTIADVLRLRGGILTAADLGRYRPVSRAPLRGTYRGYTVLTMPPPSSGGVALLEALNLLEPHDLRAGGPDSPATLHLVAEACKHAFADRARHLGDPDFSPVDARRLASKEYARTLRLFDRPQPRERYGTVALPDDGGTSHVSVVDARGNACALTTTVNMPFGSGVEAAGVVLNDEMDDFTTRPGEPNAFGLIQSPRNEVEPGKRPLSSMSPTILLRDGRVFMVVGASGGPAIITATLQTILGVVDFGRDAEAAVAAPRIHHQWVPDTLHVEPGFPPATASGLLARGHVLSDSPKRGVVQAIVVRERGRLEAASDPRKGGQPAGQ